MTAHSPRGLQLCRTLQLASATLPVGAYAYSQGMEWAVEAGWVSDEATLRGWVAEQLHHGIGMTDLPLLARLYDAAQDDDDARLRELSRVLMAHRETSELVADDNARGRALARMLDGLELAQASAWLRRDDVPFATLVAIATVAWGIDKEEALIAYTWGWLEGQVLAGVKLIPLGHLAGQRLLLDLSTLIGAAIAVANAVNDDHIGNTLPLVAIASSLHETQYTRLYRS